MKVFLSWSGGRSKSAAESLGNWIARVIQAVEPWISSGMEKGMRWQSEIADKLEEAKVGIVCVTASNLSEPWLLFEAGALSKTKGSHVCTFLLDIAPADIEPPLGQFQHTVFQKEDVFKLVQTINARVESNGERALTEANLTSVFETFWPQLDAELREIVGREEAEIVRRPDRQLLEEVLEILRGQERRRARANEAASRALKASLRSVGAEKTIRAPDPAAVREYLAGLGLGLKAPGLEPNWPAVREYLKKLEEKKADADGDAESSEPES